MTKPIRFALIASLLSLPLITQARVCVVQDFDTSACTVGDELMFVPHTFGNAQYPIQFVGQKCDLNRSITMNTGGVVCFYAGEKALFNGTEEVQKIPYAAKYQAVSQNPEGWIKRDDEYWRVLLEKGALEDPRSVHGDIKAGDYVSMFTSVCQHDKHGVETREGFVNTGQYRVATDDFLLSVGPLQSGTILEVVAPTYHRFERIEKFG